MRKNVAGQVIGAQMVSATDGSAFTGSVTVYVTGDGGTQAVGSVSSGACTHEGEGFHSYSPSQSETNYNHVAFTFKGTGAIPVTVQVYTVSYNPHDTVRLGLTALPNAAADAAGGLPVSDAGGLDLDTRLGYLTAGVATAAALATAQADLDTITGANGVTLATSQPNYAPYTGTPPSAAAIRAEIDSNSTQLAAIVADTNELQTDWADGGRLDLIVDAILVDTGTTLQAELDGIQADTEDIQSRLPAALVSGRIDASVGAMASNTLTAAALASDAVTEIQSGLATSSSIAALNNLSTSDVTSALNSYDAPTKAEMDAAFTEVKGATWSSVTDTLEAIRDRGDTAWVTATGFSTLDAAGVRSAIGLASANLDTQLSTIDTVVDSILADTGTDGVKVAPNAISDDQLHVNAVNEIRNAVTGGAYALDTDASGRVRVVSGTAAGEVSLSSGLLAWNPAWDAEVQSEVQDAIEANHLDHLLATTYDPASKPGASDALLNELVESDSGVARFTANALEQGPTGGGGVADWTSDERTAIRSILGIPASGTTPDDPSAGILDTIRDAAVAVKAKTDNLPASPAAIGDIPSASSVASQVRTELTTELSRIDASVSSRLPTASYAAPLDAAGTRTALGLAANNLDTQLAGILADTAEIGTAGAGLTALPWNPSWDAEVQSECADALASGVNVVQWRGGTPGNLDSNGFLPANTASVNGNTTRASTLSTWLDNNRLDAAVSTRASQASVDDVPTNAELAAALAAADDAILAAIAALNNLSAADVNAQVVDALATDTYAEIASVPGATASLADKINWLYAWSRNKVVATGSTQTLRNDSDSANIGTLTQSGDDTTFTRNKWS